MIKRIASCFFLLLGMNCFAFGSGGSMQTGSQLIDRVYSSIDSGEWENATTLLEQADIEKGEYNLVKGIIYLNKNYPNYNSSEGIRLLEKAASLGNRKSMILLADFYFWLYKNILHYHPN